MIHVHPDAEAVALAAAEHVTRIAHEAIEARGTFRMALAGGTTPERLYRLLAGPPWRARIDWPAVTLLFTDERAVEPDHPQRNLRMVRESCSIARRSRAGRAPDARRSRRSRWRRRVNTKRNSIHRSICGDGRRPRRAHGIGVSDPRGRARDATPVRAVLDSPKPPPRRLTLTPRAMLEARGAIVLVTGREKAAAVAMAHDATATPERCPASLLRDRDWLIDREAAADLPAHLRAGLESAP